MRKLTNMLIGTLAAVLLVSSVYAQSIEQARLNEPTASNSLGVRPASTPFSLLDFSRIKWSHSYSVSFFSGGGQSSSLALATTSMFYEISSKLSLQVDLGILHNPGAIWGSGTNNAEIVPAFTLDYRPSDNIHMSINFQRFSGGYSPYGRVPYNYGWGSGYLR